MGNFNKITKRLMDLIEKRHRPGRFGSMSIAQQENMAPTGPGVLGSATNPMMSSGSNGTSEGEFTKRMALDRMYGNNGAGSNYNVRKWLPPNNPMGTVYKRIWDKEREKFYKGRNGSMKPGGRAGGGIYQPPMGGQGGRGMAPNPMGEPPLDYGIWGQD